MDNSFSEILTRLTKANSILLITHARPDGDGLGSILAIALAARAAGKKAEILILDKIPERYLFLYEGIKFAGTSDFDGLAAQSDVVLVVDTSVRRQLDGVDAALVAMAQKVIVLDHHAVTENIGSVQWIDSTAAAAGVLAFELIDALGWEMNEKVAQALMVAITSDTGWFRFSNTDARTMRCCARLLELGVRADRLYSRLFQCDRPQRIKLMTRMLQSMELHCDNRLAVMMIRKSDFAITAALPEETENLVNEALRMCTVESAILLVENADVVRVSLRSRELIDVAAVAAEFGGGGHARAAGLRLAEDIDTLRTRLTKRMIQEFEKKRS